MEHSTAAGRPSRRATGSSRGMSRRAFLAGFASLIIVPLEEASARPPGDAMARTRLALAVRQALGKPYRWGAAGPEAFDCSGLMVWLYGRLGLRLPRQARDQGRAGARVRGRLRPGDVLLFRSPASPTGWHTGMYVGRDLFVHAAGRGRGVCLASLKDGDRRGRLVAARRYLA